MIITVMNAVITEMIIAYLIQLYSWEKNLTANATTDSFAVLFL